MTLSPQIDAWLVQRGRYVNVDFMVQSDDRQYLVRIHEGMVERIQSDPLVMPRWTFRLLASKDAWRRHFADKPEPGFHDLMAMVKFGTLRIEGDQHVFMCNLLYFKALIKALKGVVQ